VPGSTLELYRLALALRGEHELGFGTVEWLPGYSETVVAFRNGAVTVIANTGDVAVELPVGEVLLCSAELEGSALAPDQTVWMRL
jgi:alpha-glucosidase